MAKGKGGKNYRKASSGQFVTKSQVAGNSKTALAEEHGGGSTREAHRSAISGKIVDKTAAARWPDKTIPIPDPDPVRDGDTGRFIVGARGMGKLNAIEGISLSRESRAMFSEFDRQNLSPEERRAVINAKHAGKR